MPTPARPLHTHGAFDLAALLAAREVTAEALVRALLERIAELEPRVLAWEHLDRERALAEARRIDAGPRTLLGGVPLGVKDIIDTADLPTACGSAARAGHRPAQDAACVAALRAAGGVVLGKTVTTEFAGFTPGKTRNPHHPGHTPGGSSSGSAAAVAAGMVPAALGTQTAGSILRPAAYCGVLGWKPSFGLLPLAGVSPVAPTLDTLGLFARDLRDLPLLARALGAAVAVPRAPDAPRVRLCRTEAWPLAAPEAQRIVEDAAVALAGAGARVDEAELPAGFEGLLAAHATIQAYETARSLAEVRAAHADLLSPGLLAALDAGAAIPAPEYLAAQGLAAAARARLGEVFADADVLLGASATGEAPETLERTGDPAFTRVWTLLGVPCLHLPIGRGPRGLPLGVQLVGAPRADGALLAAGAWIAARLGNAAATPLPGDAAR
ncbi:MAG: amidase [Anaeromyxobacteraceae bacterium]